MTNKIYGGISDSYSSLCSLCTALVDRLDYEISCFQEHAIKPLAARKGEIRCVWHRWSGNGYGMESLCPISNLLYLKAF